MVMLILLSVMHTISLQEWINIVNRLQKQKRIIYCDILLFIYEYALAGDDILY